MFMHPYQPLIVSYMKIPMSNIEVWNITYTKISHMHIHLHTATHHIIE